MANPCLINCIRLIGCARVCNCRRRCVALRTHTSVWPGLPSDWQHSPQGGGTSTCSCRNRFDPLCAVMFSRRISESSQIHHYATRTGAELMATLSCPLILLSGCRMRCVRVAGELCAARALQENSVVHKTVGNMDFKGDTHKPEHGPDCIGSVMHWLHARARSPDVTELVR